MAASKERIDWAMLILRIAVGGYAILHGLGPLLQAKGAITIPHVARLGISLMEMACGGLMMAGVWMVPSSAALLVIMGWPLAHSWLHGGRLLGDVPSLFRLMATLASGIGGAGKWSPSN